MIKNNDPIFTSYDYAIGGKMVVGRAVIDESFVELMKTDIDAKLKLKRDLVHQMAEFMLENNLVEFTQQDDPLTFRKHVAVRAYLAPNDQVKILRVANKIV